MRYVLTKDAATNVWSKTASVATLKNTYGITGTVYYGYRAWGPNWPYNAGWTKGSGTGFVTDIDASGNRFNPNKLLIDPYAVELSQDPSTPTCTDGTIYASGATHRNKDSGAVRQQGHRAGRRHHVQRHQAHARAEGRRRLRSACARPDQGRHRQSAAA